MLDDSINFLDEFAREWRWNGWWIDDELLLSVKLEKDDENLCFSFGGRGERREEKFDFHQLL